MNIKNNFITLPDIKTRTVFVSEISNKLKLFLHKYLESYCNKNPDSFVFYPKYTHLRKRLQTIKQKINRRIKSSFKEKNILPEKVTLSSHIFRKTKCFNYFNDELRELIKNAGLQIGHVKGSRATRHYIYSNDKRMLPENSVPLILDNGLELEDEHFQSKMKSHKDKIEQDKIPKRNYILRKRKRDHYSDSTEIENLKPKVVLKTRKSKKSKFTNSKLIEFYKVNFSKWNKVMEGYVYKYKNIVLFEGGKIIAAATFNRVELNTYEVVDLILIATDPENRNQGLGSFMIEILRKLNTKLVVWADNTRIEWYAKRGFEVATEFWNYFKEKVLDFTGSTFLITGFSSEDKNKFRQNFT
jgi:GNAT superfamily N-acetyltransferase